jgi:DNA-binding SARP family transcriptional activator
MLEFRLLGPLEVIGDDGSLRLGGIRQRATLAILLLGANRVVSIERIADDLYAGEPPVTAVTQVQRQVSELRKLLGSEASIETRSPGYVINAEPGQIDLQRFERLTAEGTTSLTAGDAATAFDRFSCALSLWRGEPLGDLRYESFAQPVIERLEELRLAAIEQRIDAELLLGRHVEVIPELEGLAGEHPLRERVRGQLMRALYAAGRQAEALEVYQSVRRRFADELGIEPTPSLRALEQAILRHDPALATASGPSQARAEDGPVLVVARDVPSAANLLAAAVPLAGADREVVAVCLVDDAARLRETAAQLNRLRESVDGRVRTATFTSADPAADVNRLSAAHDAAVLMLEHATNDTHLPEPLARILLRSPADVVLVTRRVDFGRGDGIYAVFGGNEHDWAAVEVAARLAAVQSAPLRLVGTTGAPGRPQRDSSRLLADAALAVQRVVGVDSEPLLADATAEGLAAAVSSATVVVAGISPRWRQAGIGSTRQVLARGDVPALVVHRGLRPGILAPQHAATRYTWSIQT